MWVWGGRGVGGVVDVGVGLGDEWSGGCGCGFRGWVEWWMWVWGGYGGWVEWWVWVWGVWGMWVWGGMGDGCGGGGGGWQSNVLVKLPDSHVGGVGLGDEWSGGCGWGGGGYGGCVCGRVVDGYGQERIRTGG